MNMDCTSKVTLTIPSEAEFIDIVRLNLFGMASKIGFSYEEIEDIKVAVSEACNNVVLHAYPHSHLGRIHICIELIQQGIRISIKDEGSSFDFQEKIEASTSLHDKNINELHIGGLGLYLMQALMDKVEINEYHGTEVSLTKFLSKIEGDLTNEAEPESLF